MDYLTPYLWKPYEMGTVLISPGNEQQRHREIESLGPAYTVRGREGLGPGRLNQSPPWKQLCPDAPGSMCSDSLSC